MIAWLRRQVDKLEDALDVFPDEDFVPCPERHPVYLNLCGNWPYARKHKLYSAGHAQPHVMVGQAPRADGLGYDDNVSDAWWTP